MTKEEAKRIIEACDEWIGNISADEAPLDGRFTRQQLEAVLALMRATDEPSADSTPLERAFSESSATPIIEASFRKLADLSDVPMTATEVLRRQLPENYQADVPNMFGLIPCFVVVDPNMPPGQIELRNSTGQVVRAVNIAEEIADAQRTTAKMPDNLKRSLGIDYKYLQELLTDQHNSAKKSAKDEPDCVICGYLAEKHTGPERACPAYSNVRTFYTPEKSEVQHQHTDECWEPGSGCDMGCSEAHAVKGQPNE